MSSPRHGALPQAWQSLGLAAPARGAACPGYAPSATRHARDNTCASHAIREKAAEDHPGIGRAVEHEYRSVRLQELQYLSSQSAMPQERSTCPLLAGRAQASRGALRVTRALAEDAR